MNVIVDSVKLISDIPRDVKFALFEDLPGFPGYIPQLKKGEFFRLYDSNAITARTPELMAVEHTFDAQTKRHTVLTPAYEFIFHQMDEDPPKKKRIVAKLYMETPIGRRAFEEYHSDGTLLAHGHYKTKIYASDLPPWFLYGYMYKRHGFMSAKDLLAERERLFAAIHDAKAKLDIDFDAEASLNNNRHNITTVLRRMADIRSSEVISQNGGYGYRFNTDGNQVSYKCDVKRVTTINFDRNLVRKYAAELSKQSDEVSNQLDHALVNSEVEYEAPFDVNDTFADVFDGFTKADQAGE